MSFLSKILRPAARRAISAVGDLPPPTPAIFTQRSERLSIAVAGAHLSGLPLNHELTDLKAILERETRTARCYRLYALNGTVPAKPGLIREPGFEGPGIAVEIWSLQAAAFGYFVSRIPQPLGIGKLKLIDGGLVSGFLCEAAAITEATDITKFGGWRNYQIERGREP